MEKVKSLDVQYFDLYRRSRDSLIGIEIIYKLITFFLLTPLTHWLLRFSLTISPTKYITNSPLSLLMAPAYVAALVIVGIAMMWWAFFEISCIITGIDMIKNGVSITAFTLFKKVFATCRRALKKQNIIIILLSGVLLPFAYPILAGNYISQLSIPEYIMDVIRETPLYLIGYTLLLLAIAYVIIRYIFSLWYFCIDGDDFSEACKKSASIHSNIKKLLNTIKSMLIVSLRLGIFWCLMFIVIGVLIYLIVVLLKNSSLALATSVVQSSMMIPLMGYFLNCIIMIGVYCILSGIYYVHRDGEIALSEDNVVRKFRSRIFVPVCIAAITLFCVVVILALSFFPRELTGEILSQNTTVTAHRGYVKHAPENTLKAFKDAIDSGNVDYVEMDVQMTKDGVVVINHDATLARTTGVDARTCDMTLKEIKELTVSGVDVDGKTVTGKIASFEEVLKLCKGRIMMNVEIKGCDDTPELEAETVRLINEYGMAESTVITSLKYQSLVKVKEADKNIKTGYILAMGVGAYYDLPCADFFSVETTFITKNMVESIHMLDKEVHAWTVSEEYDATKMIERGVDSIITNDPDLIMEVIKDSQAEPLKMYSLVQGLIDDLTKNKTKEDWEMILQEI